MTDADYHAPRLAVNVWVRRTGYGPGFGDTVPPVETWAELPADVWVGGEVPEPVLEASFTSSQPFPVATVNPVGEPVFTAPTDPSPERPAPADPEGEAPVADLPADKASLLAYADEHGIEVDRRLGAAKLRQVIASREWIG